MNEMNQMNEMTHGLNRGPKEREDSNEPNEPNEREDSRAEPGPERTRGLELFRAPVYQKVNDSSVEFSHMRSERLLSQLIDRREGAGKPAHTHPHNSRHVSDWPRAEQWRRGNAGK